MRTEDFSKRAASSYKASAGVGADGFHPKTPLDPSAETCGNKAVFLAIVERWVQASTLLFFLIPKNVTSERPIALLSTVIRWWEWLTAPVIQEWKKKSRVEWDATQGKQWRSRKTVWEAWLDVDKYNYKVEEMDQGAVTLVLVSAEACAKGVAESGMGLRDALLTSHNGFSGYFAGTFSTSEGLSWRDAWRIRCKASQQFFLYRSGVVCLFVWCSRTLKVFLPLKLKAFVDDIKLHLWKTNQEV